MSENAFERILNWLREGYPEGVPPKDHFALLALLKRRLSEDEIVQACQVRPQEHR